MVRTIIKGISAAFSHTILLVLVMLYFTQPSYYRALTPSLFGLQEVAPNIFTDRPNRLPDIRNFIRKARENSGQFFGKKSAEPTYILCMTQDCADIFGALPLGLTLGYQRVIIAPDGFSQRVFNHEQVHVDLHRLMGLRGFFSTRYPMWFNEGLAEYLSGSSCQRVAFSRGEIARIKQVETFSQWNRVVADRQYRRHYGAACRAVEQIAQRTGRLGLRDLVLNAKNKTQFLTSLPK